MSAKRVIWSGDDIRTTAGFDPFAVWRGWVLEDRNNGEIVANVYRPGDEEDVFGVPLEADEWEVWNYD